MKFRPPKHYAPDFFNTWHFHFALWPVKLLDGRRAWLETVEKRIVTVTGLAAWFYEYREYKKPTGGDK